MRKFELSPNWFYYCLEMETGVQNKTSKANNNKIDSEKKSTKTENTNLMMNKL